MAVSGYIKEFGLNLALAKFCSGKLPEVSRVYKYLVERYLNDHYLGKVKITPTKDIEKIGEFSPIWVCWWQGEEAMPSVVKIAYRSILENAGTHPVVLITQDNFCKYARRAARFKDKVLALGLSITAFSDYLRFDLLNTYGGIWLDSTLYLSHSLDSWVEQSQLFTIKQGDQPFHTGRWNPLWSKLWASYCWGGGKGNPLFGVILDLYDLYFDDHTELIDYFLIDRITNFAYSNFPKIRESIDLIPENNPDVLLLDSNLSKSPKSFKPDSDTFLFKLSWKKRYQIKEKSGKYTLYKSLLDSYDIQ